MKVYEVYRWFKVRFWDEAAALQEAGWERRAGDAILMGCIGNRAEGQTEVGHYLHTFRHNVSISGALLRARGGGGGGVLANPLSCRVSSGSGNGSGLVGTSADSCAYVSDIQCSRMQPVPRRSNRLLSDEIKTVLVLQATRLWLIGLDATMDVTGNHAEGRMAADARDIRTCDRAEDCRLNWVAWHRGYGHSELWGHSHIR